MIHLWVLAECLQSSWCTVFIIIALCNWWSVPQLITASTYIFRATLNTCKAIMKRLNRICHIHFMCSICYSNFFFLAGYNSSWSVVCSCELWNLFLICAFLYILKVVFFFVFKNSFLHFLLERDLACNATFLIFI